MENIINANTAQKYAGIIGRIQAAGRPVRHGRYCYNVMFAPDGDGNALYRVSAWDAAHNSVSISWEFLRAI